MKKFLVKMLLHKNRNTFQQKNAVKTPTKVASILNLQEEVLIVTLGPVQWVVIVSDLEDYMEK
jgi:hypothetical protein